MALPAERANHRLEVGVRALRVLEDLGWRPAHVERPPSPPDRLPSQPAPVSAILSNELRPALALALCATSSPASADVFGGQVHWLRGTTHVHELELAPAPGEHEPESLGADRPRLWGFGTFRGASARFDVLSDSTRYGAGLSLFGVDGVSVRTDHASARPSAIWGGSIESFVGQEIGQGPVYPYLDLRGSFSLLEVDLETPDDGTRYLGWRFGLGPRFGVLIPIGHSSMVDVAIYRRLIGGVEDTSLFVGLGYWENDRTDDFSQYLRGHRWRGEI